jgi:hypothetical protein
MWQHIFLEREEDDLAEVVLQPFTQPPHIHPVPAPQVRDPQPQSESAGRRIGNPLWNPERDIEIKPST